MRRATLFALAALVAAVAAPCQFHTPGAHAITGGKTQGASVVAATGCDTFTPVSNDAPQVCTGGPTMNSWCGHGQVDALRALANAR